MSLTLSLILALAAGLAIPAGALLSSHVALRSLCLQHEIDSFIGYFAGGALLAAIALVLLPYGIEHTSVLGVCLAFLAGGIVFWRLDVWIKNSGAQAAQFIGMLLDFVPEATLLGAAAASGSNVSYLLAGFIACKTCPRPLPPFMRCAPAQKAKNRPGLFFWLRPWPDPWLPGWASAGWGCSPMPWV